ncbi:NADP-dependent phosphogluconate dehydrogenase [Candidatus Peregrinibacteria bacterium]|nr:NADP-dependent phosphogluconate dehydrogenase [Candidatus Peregrinibacteria bacterium]
MEKSEIGLIGLAVMGQNLARNIADKGFQISVYNRTLEKTTEFIKKYGHSSKSGVEILGTVKIEEFVKSLKSPRKIIIMVKAGEAVDEVISELLPHLEKSDIIMDGGNSYYKDTEQRQKSLESSGISLIGMGISGGEEGALKGPSIMPGGNREAYEKVAPILTKIAADEDTAKSAKCVSYMGKNGSGHFVKMVHNGIEYAIMQLIAEIYDILKNLGKLSNEELAKTFENWNKTDYLKSFLVEITAKIFRKKDEKGQYLIDQIRDHGEQKGTGKWTSIASFDYGIATPTITSAVNARILSAFEKRRQIALPQVLNSQIKIPDKKTLIKLTQDALELCEILSYFQGFDLIAIANKEHNWRINLPEIARIWKNGCIIRSSLLDEFQTHNFPQFLFTDEKQNSLRHLIAIATAYAIPIPAVGNSLFYYDTLSAQKLPQNLTQAQRDFFGAHGYAKIGQEGTFHTDWQ